MSPSRRRRACSLFLAIGLASSCAAPERPGPSGSPDAGAEAARDVAPALARCRAPAGVNAAPRTIAELVTLVNALPRPLELTCFLETLDRPLDANAVVSIFSLQPARGERSPRIFLLSGDLVMSLAPTGPGSHLLEVSQIVEERRSVKGEIVFPVTATLSPSAPYDKVRDPEGTTCRFCHPFEDPWPALPNAYVSGAFAPDPRHVVDLAIVAREHEICDPAAEPARCAFLRALFAHGEVRQKPFPPAIPTIFGQ
jgi:hypothetical protein